MLNMLRVNIENRIRAKALIEFCLLHWYFAGVLNFEYHNTQINAKYFHIHRIKCTITTLTSLPFLELSFIFVRTSTSGISLLGTFKVHNVKTRTVELNI